MFQINKILANTKTVFLSIAVLLMLSQPWPAYAVDGHGDEDPHSSDHSDQHDGHSDHQEHQEGTVFIAPHIAKQAGIAVATVSSAALEIVTQAYGQLMIAPDQAAHIHARFPGLVKTIKPQVGDRVSKGEVLAVIESNQSLRDYRVTAPITGIVSQRLVNTGEVTGDEPLMVIVNPQQLWAELKIFPLQRDAVKLGLPVYLAREQREVKAEIMRLVPTDHQQPYQLAYVTVDNTALTFTPGELVRADIVIDKVPVPVAVDNRALQTLEGQPVVFIQEGERYERRVLKLGRSDGRFTEVLDGLHVGSRYVTQNSYLIKADIEKAGAGHHH